MIIGVSGKKRHGKGTVAGILVREYGFTQLDFADALRGDMAVLNPLVSAASMGRVGDMVYGWTYNEAIEHFGYERAKEEFPEIVRLLQVYGSEIGRDRISKYHWVERWQSAIMGVPDDVSIVASDVRFESEVDAVRFGDDAVRFGNDTYHFVGVRRLGYVHNLEADKHQSEQLPELPDDASTIIEASSVESLTAQLHTVMARLGFERHTNQKGSN